VFCREFAGEMNRLRMEQRADLSSAKRDLECVKQDIKKVIDAIKAGYAGPELKAEMDDLQALARTDFSRSSPRPTSPRRSCIRAWPTSTGARSRNSRRRSSARTHVWKPQRCSAG
jgi:hypothetical protein